MERFFSTGGRLTVMLAAGMLLAGGAPQLARAADLGGDCCIDLEERVAALEATSVTHGTRRMTMKISGWVNAGVMWWADQGGSTDVRDPSWVDHNSGFEFVNNDAAQTRVYIEGAARISNDLSAGYNIGIRPWGDKLSSASQIAHGVDPNNVDIRDTYVFLDAKNIGKLQLGQQVSAADSAWYQDLGGSSTWISNINPGAWNTAFHLRDVTGGLTNITWGSVLQEMSDTQAPRIAYYSRDLGGFQAAASYGDQTWAVALYFTRKFGSFNIASGIGYDVSDAGAALSDQAVGTGLVDSANTHLAKLAVSGSVYESNSGLYGTLGYSKVAADTAGRSDASNLYAKAGWRRNISGFGETNLYGEYDRTAAAYASGINAHLWGVGVTQDIDSVGSVLYVGYRHTSLENDAGNASLILTADQVAAYATPTSAAAVASQSFDAVLGGMVVQF